MPTSPPFRRLQRILRTAAFSGLFAILLASCATTAGSASGAPYPELEAEFIPDRRPIRDPRTTDLLAFAETLPVYHSRDPKTWVRPTPTAGMQEGEWLMRTAGASTPVRIQRLAPSAGGAQRIKVLVGPSSDSQISPPPVWSYELERTTGGWKQSF